MPRCLACCLVLFVSMVVVVPFVSADDAAMFQTLQDRTLAELLASGPASNVPDLVKTLRDDGTWPDVDYADKTRGGWKTAQHVYRLVDLARAYCRDGSPLQGDAKLREAVLRALDHWLAKDYKCPNWWYNEIGVPKELADFGLLMEDELSPQQREKLLEIIARATFAQTGQNSVWRAGITFRRALIEDDIELARKARDIILQDLIVTTEEGVQPDFSFHQHGPQQQFGNYGLAFAGDMTKWGLLWRDTPLALSDEQLTVLRRYVIDGQSWVVHRGRMDVSACGRQLFKGTAKSKAGSLRSIVDRMRTLDPEYADRYAAILDGDWGDRDHLASETASNRHFWRSDYMIHRTKDWMVSIKMNSPRTIGCETCNSENMQGYHTADGAMFTYVEGDEYDDIYPVWDWRSLPGVTCIDQEALAPAPNTRDRNKSEFVGGLSDGRFGIAVLDYDRAGVKAKKAWFCLDDAVVCMGAGITSEKDGDLGTTIEQCFVQGEKEGETRHNGRVGYLPILPRDIEATRGPQTGTWKSVRTSYSDTPVTRDVFSLRIKHDGAIDGGDRYLYVVLPNATTEQTASAMSTPMGRILANDASTQALYAKQGDAILAVFHEPGEVKATHTIAVDEPCLVLLRETEDGLALCVADPTQKLASLHVTIDGASHAIDLPQDGMAGSTATAAISVK